MASLFKKLSKRLKLPMPGGTLGKYATVGKVGAALALGPALGPVNPFSMDPDVIGARGSAKKPGLSVAREQEYAQDERTAVAAEGARVAAAGVETEAQLAAKRAQDEQLAARRRAKQFAYGYNRSQAGGLGGAGGAAGGQKTLLGT